MKHTSIALLAVAAITSSSYSLAQESSEPAAITIMDISGIDNDRLLPKINRNSLTKGKKNGEVSAYAPADPLWHVEIDYIGSSDIGWEYIPASAFSTTQNHGGAQLRARVLELGYGGSRFAWMNGSQLSSSANYLNDDICWDFYGNLTYNCTAGMILAGYARYYSLDGHQSGTFQYQSTSIVSPWNTEFDSLYIQ